MWPMHPLTQTYSGRRRQKRKAKSLVEVGLKAKSGVKYKRLRHKSWKGPLILWFSVLLGHMTSPLTHIYRTVFKRLDIFLHPCKRNSLLICHMASRVFLPHTCVGPLVSMIGWSCKIEASHWTMIFTRLISVDMTCESQSLAPTYMRSSLWQLGKLLSTFHPQCVCIYDWLIP